MLNKFKNVFILGAGASKPYNLPLGYELFCNICKDFDKCVSHYNRERRKIGSDKTITINAENFIINLRKVIPTISIDKYLNINQKFMKIGKIAITFEILRSENKSTLPNYQSDIEGDWYSYLFYKMTEGLDQTEEMKNLNLENKISFITFNYDRTLEEFLYKNYYYMLKNAGISNKEVTEILLKIPIIHVYGKIGFLPWENSIYEGKEYDLDKGMIDYQLSELSTMGSAIKLSNNIELIYEEREKSPEIEKAKNLIMDSDRVFFLGFGFDPRNIEILNLPEVLQGKEVLATAYNKTENEIRQFQESLGIKPDLNGFFRGDSLSLLREFLR